MKRSKEQQLTLKLKDFHSIPQLKSIFKNSLSANQSLYGDIQMLKQKLKQCGQKSKNFLPSQQTITAIQKCRQQLQSKYKTMHELKRRNDKNQSHLITSTLKEQRERSQNELFEVQKQLQLIKRERNDNLKEGRKLQSTVKNLDDLAQFNTPPIHVLEAENVELRRKITTLTLQSKKSEIVSAKAINEMYNHKAALHQRHLSQSAKDLHGKSDNKIKNKNNIIHNGKNSSMELLKAKQIEEEKRLQMQILQLKKECQNVSNNHLKEESILKNKIAELLNKNKEILRTSNQLQKTKTKLHSQLNKFNKLINNVIRIALPVSPKQYSDSFSQTFVLNKQISSINKPLRRDFAGILGGRFSFDERIALGEERIVKIVGFTVYEYEYLTGRTILTAIQAHHQRPFQKTIDIPTSFLSKCNKKTHMLLEGDYLKQIKVKNSNIQNRIMKVQFKSNRNLKFEYGDKKDMGQVLHGESVYMFDIQQQEYPVCFFGAYSFYRQYWQLQAFGCEILTQADK